jgi:hypothetical protein
VDLDAFKRTAGGSVYTSASGASGNVFLRPSGTGLCFLNATAGSMLANLSTSDGNTGIGLEHGTNTFGYIGITQANNYVVGAANDDTFVRAENKSIVFSRDAGGSVAGKFDANGWTVALFEQNGTTATITAANPGVQGDVPLTTTYNVVTTCAHANDAVTMPPALAGRRVTIWNKGAQTLEIWPASGDDCGSGVDTAVTLAASSHVTYVARDATNWEGL